MGIHSSCYSYHCNSSNANREQDGPQPPCQAGLPRVLSPLGGDICRSCALSCLGWNLATWRGSPTWSGLLPGTLWEAWPSSPAAGGHAHPPWPLGASHVGTRPQQSQICPDSCNQCKKRKASSLPKRSLSWEARAPSLKKHHPEHGAWREDARNGRGWSPGLVPGLGRNRFQVESWNLQMPGTDVGSSRLTQPSNRSIISNSKTIPRNRAFSFYSLQNVFLMTSLRISIRKCFCFRELAQSAAGETVVLRVVRIRLVLEYSKWITSVLTFKLYYINIFISISTLL